MSQFSPTPPPSGLIPPGRIRGMELARVGWAVVRARWRLLLPAAAVMSAAAAVLQVGLAVWIFGGLERAADFRFALDGLLAQWLNNPTAGAPENLAGSIVALMIGNLVLPTVVTVAAALVVLDVTSGRVESWRGYLSRAGRTTPGAIASTLAGAAISATPIVFTMYIAWQLRGTTTVVTAGNEAIEVPIYSVVTLLVLGLPAITWLVYATARLALAVQVLVADNAGPLIAVRTAWTITQRQVARVLGITLLTALTAASIGQIIAAPVTLVGTISSLGQQEKTSGRMLVEAFISGAVGGTVTLVITGVIAALLTLDVRRGQAPS